MIVTRPSVVVKPVIAFGEPFGLFIGMVLSLQGYVVLVDYGAEGSLGQMVRRKYQPLEKELGDQLELQEPLLLLLQVPPQELLPLLQELELLHIESVQQV